MTLCGVVASGPPAELLERPRSRFALGVLAVFTEPSGLAELAGDGRLDIGVGNATLLQIAPDPVAAVAAALEPVAGEALSVGAIVEKPQLGEAGQGRLDLRDVVFLGQLFAKPGRAVVSTREQAHGPLDSGRFFLRQRPTPH